MFYRLFDIFTIGFPFGVFKITSGLYYQVDFLFWWGLIDIIINAFNFLMTLIYRKKILASCLLSIIGAGLAKKTNTDSTLTEDIGESLDVLFSFIIVAVVIGSGNIANFENNMLQAWNIAVVLNVLGAGSARLVSSIKRYRKA